MKKTSKIYNFDKMSPGDWDDLVALKDFNVLDKLGKNPLFYACSNGLFSLAHLLINAGSDVEVQTPQGQTPLHDAFSPEIAKLLIESGASLQAQDIHKNSPLHTAWHKDVVQVLIEAGAYIDFQNEIGQTPLHSHKNPEITSLLLSSGANVMALDDDGNTPLHHVTNVESASLMLEAGSNIRLKNKKRKNTFRRNFKKHKLFKTRIR